MKKVISSLCVLLALCLMLTGCPGLNDSTPVETTPEPEISLDGTWIHSITVPADESCPAFTYESYKIVINGSSVKSFFTTDEYAQEAAEYAILEAIANALGGELGPAPLPEYNTINFGTGTVSIKKDKVTFTFNRDGETQIIKGTVSEDGTTITINEENETLVFKKQAAAAGPLEGVWVTGELNEDPPYAIIYNKIVFSGNNFQMYIAAEENAIFPDIEYGFPYALYGTYAVNGTNVTLTLANPPEDMPGTLSGVIDDISFSICFPDDDEEEGIAEMWYMSVADLASLLSSSGSGGTGSGSGGSSSSSDSGTGFNADGSLDGTWLGIVTAPLTTWNDYSGFVTIKLEISGSNITKYNVTDACAYNMGNWNHPISTTYHDQTCIPEPEWDEGEALTFEEFMGEIWLGQSIHISSDDNWETFSTNAPDFGPITFYREGEVPAGNTDPDPTTQDPIPEPPLNLDGIWFSEETVPATETYDEHTRLFEKIVFDGENFSLYNASEEYQNRDIAYWELVKTPAEGMPLYEPPVTWTFVTSGTWTNEGNELTFNTSGNDESTASLNEDETTFSVDDTVTFEKQDFPNEGPLTGIWRTPEGAEIIIYRTYWVMYFTMTADDGTAATISAMNGTVSQSGSNLMLLINGDDNPASCPLKNNGNSFVMYNNPEDPEDQGLVFTRQ